MMKRIQSEAESPAHIYRIAAAIAGARVRATPAKPMRVYNVLWTLLCDKPRARS